MRVIIASSSEPPRGNGRMSSDSRLHNCYRFPAFFGVF